VELREQHALWGLDRHEVEGTWEALVQRVRDSGDTGIISHEILAGAVGGQLERVARTTAGLELHLVVTARDLARQATAHWQEEVKNGRPWSYAEFREELFGPGEAEDQELGFWRSQDLLSVLDRWGALVGPDRVHVVVVPPSGTDRVVLWHRFAEAVGIAPALLEDHLPPPRNESLGAAQVALLRQVVAALDGRLGQPHHAHVVKRFFAQTLLSRAGTPRPVAPADLRERLGALSAGWPAELWRRGYRVYGDPAELLPAPPPPDLDTRDPDDVPPEEVLAGLPETLADLLVEVADLRGQVTGPHALPPLHPEAPEPGPESGPEPEAAEPEGSEEASRPSAWRRLGRRAGRRLGP
jgi:hypothetical protein